MAARNWIVATLIAAALAGPACALVFGIEDLPTGTGGSGGGGSGSSSTGATTSTASKSASSTSGSHSTSSSTSSSGTGSCTPITSCDSCITCMENGPCHLADAGCPNGSMCAQYTACIVQCPFDSGVQQCMTGCNSAEPPEYPALKACLCGQCTKQCPQMCG
jgi:hypothetical protein